MTLPYDEALYAAWAETYDSPSEREERDATLAGRWEPTDSEIVAAQDEAFDESREYARYRWMTDYPTLAFM